LRAEIYPAAVAGSLKQVKTCDAFFDIIPVAVLFRPVRWLPVFQAMELIWKSCTSFSLSWWLRGSAPKSQSVWDKPRLSVN